MRMPPWSSLPLRTGGRDGVDLMARLALLAVQSGMAPSGLVAAIVTGHLLRAASCEVDIPLSTRWELASRSILAASSPLLLALSLFGPRDGVQCTDPLLVLALFFDGLLFASSPHVYVRVPIFAAAVEMALVAFLVRAESVLTLMAVLCALPFGAAVDCLVRRERKQRQVQPHAHPHLPRCRR